jgi:hypothetical protein
VLWVLLPCGQGTAGEAFEKCVSDAVLVGSFPR